MLEPKSVTVNGRSYTVLPMNATEIIDFVHGFQEAKSAGKGVATYAKKAIGQCLDGMGRNLSDIGNFDQCFNEHPEDLFELEGKALDIIVSPFLKRPQPTAKSAKASTGA